MHRELLVCLAAFFPAIALGQPPRIFYTDLVSGPTAGGQNNNGAFITLYGERFGPSPAGASVIVGGGVVAAYPVWTDTKVTVQLGPSALTGAIVLTNAAGASNGTPFTVAAGNIYFVSPGGSDTAGGSFSTPWQTLTHARDTLAPGDIVYAMDGVAQATDDGQGWSSCLTLGANAGAPGALKAMVVYPGASATIGNVNPTSAGGCDTAIRGKGQGESYWAFAGFTIRGGGITLNPVSETGWRIVGNDLSCPNGNGQAGCLDLAYETSLAVYGNNIHHVGTNLNPATVTALYHGVYISEFNHGVDFGWNTIAYVQGCRGLQQNVNQGSSSYDLHIHDNIIHDTQCDGIVMTTIDPSQGTVELYNNIIYNTGTGPANAENTGAWNCLLIEGYDPSGYGPGSGTVEVYNNTLYNCGTWANPPYGQSEGMLLWANEGNPKKSMRIRNNIIYASTVSPYCDDSVCSGLTGSNNIFYGNGPPPANGNITGSLNVDPKLTNLSPATPDFHLQPGSPAIDAGVTISGLATDFDGILRPQGSAFDIGAYEYISHSPALLLAVSPPVLAYGSVAVDQPATLTATVTNTGNQNVTLSGASIAGTGFTIAAQPAYPAVLRPNASAQYTVKFAPAAVGVANGTLTISSNATNSPSTVALSGTAVVPTLLLSATPTTLAFGNIVLNQGSTLTTTIANTGTAAVTLSAASLTGTGFSIAAQPVYPVTLAPGATAQVSVRFSPNVTGAAAGKLTMTSNSTNSPLVVSLLGVGVVPGPITLGKKGSNGTGASGSASPISISWNGGGSTAGSSAIVVVVYGANGPYAASNITDSAGNIYRLDATVPHPHTGAVYVFSCLNAAAATSVTVTPPSFGNFQIAALEYSGLLTSGALDKVSAMYDDGFQSSSGAYKWTTNPSGTLARPSELVLAINAEAYGNVTSYSAPGYKPELLQASPTGALGILDAITSSNHSVTPAGTYTETGGSWVGSFLLTYMGNPVQTMTLAVSPSRLVFRQAGTLNATITNTGTASVTIDAVSITGRGFTLTGAPPQPVALPPNATVEYRIGFTPTAAADASGLLTVSSNATGPPLTVLLLEYRHGPRR